MDIEINLKNKKKESNNNKIKFKLKKSLLNPNKKNKLSRYDSAIFLNNYMQKKKIEKSHQSGLIKNFEFSFPIKKFVCTRNNPNYRLNQFYKCKSSPQFNKEIKLIRNNNIFNTIRNNEFLNKNCDNPHTLYKPFNYNNENNNEKGNNILTNTFYYPKMRKENNFINSYLNKFSETEKPDKIQKEIIPLIESDRSVIKDKLPINTLKHYHRYLFHNNKSNCKCNEEEKGKSNNKNTNYSQSWESSSQFNNKICEYDVIELGGKMNYVATKLTKPKNKNEKNLNRSKSLINLNLKKKQDFHFLMKHPFSNSYFCSSFINQLTDNNNNSYTNNFSEKFQNLNNPLNDKDLTDKLHNLILNPNTSKIRNGELLLMYKKFPKGTFYNIGKNNNNNNYDLLYNEELKKLEKTKYRKYIIKLNKTMERAKSIQKKLNNYLYINKNNP